MCAASLLPLFHHFPEVAKQIIRVVRAGAASGWYCTLNSGSVLMAQAFERVVVQVDMRQLDFASVDRLRIDGKTVVVRGDFHLAGLAFVTGWLPP